SPQRSPAALPEGHHREDHGLTRPRYSSDAKKPRLVGGIVVFCSWAIIQGGALAGEPPVALRHRFTDGQIRYIQVKETSEKRTIVSFFPDPVGTTEEREWWIIATTGKSDAAGTAGTWKVDRLQARHRDSVGGSKKPEQSFDSLRPANAGQLYMLTAWTNRV